MALIGLILLVLIICYTGYANPLWKLHENSAHYANGIFRALIGILAWLTIILAVTGDYESAFGGVVFTAAAMLIPLLRMKKDGILSLRYVFLLLMASLGVYVRIILNWTLIGIPVANFLKRIAEIGYSNTCMEWVEHMQGVSNTPTRSTTESAPFEFPNYVLDKNGNQYSHSVSHNGGATYIGPGGNQIFLKPHQIDGFRIR